MNDIVGIVHIRECLIRASEIICAHNIDVYDLDGSYGLFHEYCDRYELCDNCPIHKIHGVDDCYSTWLFMPPDLERKRRKNHANT